jgi:hypothetical protein
MTIAILNAHLLIVIVSVIIVCEAYVIVQSNSFKYISACLTSIIFLCQPLDASTDFQQKSYSLKPKYSIENIGKASLIIVATGFAAYALTKLSSWLFAQSDTTIADQAYNAILQAQSRYAQVMAILNEEKLSYINENACIQSISEQTLYEIAQAKYYDTDITLYLQQLESTIKNIESHLSEIQQTIQSLQSNSNIDHKSTQRIVRMHAIESIINKTLPFLKFTYAYLSHHATYFLLFETENEMLYHYEQCLQAIDRYPDDINTLREVIHQSVMSYQFLLYDPYPYHRYLKLLENDINTLHIAMNKLSYEYTNRYNAVYALCNKLEYIRSTALNSPYYTQEIHRYEYEQLMQKVQDSQNQYEPILVTEQLF